MFFPLLPSHKHIKKKQTVEKPGTSPVSASTVADVHTHSSNFNFNQIQHCTPALHLRLLFYSTFFNIIIIRSKSFFCAPFWHGNQGQLSVLVFFFLNEAPFPLPNSLTPSSLTYLKLGSLWPSWICVMKGPEVLWDWKVPRLPYRVTVC